MVMQDWWWCVRCDRIESGVWNVVGCMRGDVYSSLACRIPTHVALLTSRSHWLMPFPSLLGPPPAPQSLHLFCYIGPFRLSIDYIRIIYGLRP